ncbi:MAG TPA: hypothetical protein VGE07_17470 [Herpetosiphonaceae bacterium]
MSFRRPFLITLIAAGYIVASLVSLVVASGLFPSQRLSALVSGSPTTLAMLGGLELLFGLALFRGASWAWWLVVAGALVPLGSHIFGGLSGEPWGWGTILWNIVVLAYMQSRDVQAFFGREAY